MSAFLLIQVIMAVYVPLAAIGLPETRTHIILEKRAKKLRKERGLRDGGRYTARSELHRQSIWAGLKASSTRPIRESETPIMR